MSVYLNVIYFFLNYKNTGTSCRRVQISHVLKKCIIIVHDWNKTMVISLQLRSIVIKYILYREIWTMICIF